MFELLKSVSRPPTSYRIRALTFDAASARIEAIPVPAMSVTIIKARAHHTANL